MLQNHAFKKTPQSIFQARTTAAGENQIQMNERSRKTNRLEPIVHKNRSQSSNQQVAPTVNSIENNNVVNRPLKSNSFIIRTKKKSYKENCFITNAADSAETNIEGLIEAKVAGHSCKIQIPRPLKNKNKPLQRTRSPVNNQIKSPIKQHKKQGVLTQVDKNIFETLQEMNYEKNHIVTRVQKLTFRDNSPQNEKTQSFLCTRTIECSKQAIFRKIKQKAKKKSQKQENQDPSKKQPAEDFNIKGLYSERKSNLKRTAKIKGCRTRPINWGAKNNQVSGKQNRTRRKMEQIQVERGHEFKWKEFSELDSIEISQIQRDSRQLISSMCQQPGTLHELFIELKSKTCL